MTPSRAALIPLLTAILAASLAVGMINTALPTIADELHISPSARAWVVDVYPLALAMSIVVAARLGDRYGRRRTLIAGLAGFAALNIAALTAGSAAAVIGIRAASGIAGALMLASVVGTIGALYRGRDLAIANGLWVAVFGAANAAAPALGGLLTQAPGWRWVMVACAPIAIAALIATLSLLPETSTLERVSFDPASIAGVTVGLGGVVVGVQHVAQDPLVGGVALGIGTGALIAFVLRQCRLAMPLIEIGLFTRPQFRTAFARIVVSAATNAACSYLVSIHLQDDLGRSPIDAGIALVPQAVAAAGGGLFIPAIAQRTGNSVALRVALAIQAGGLFALAYNADAVTIPIAAVGLGLGIVGTLATTDLFESSPRSASGQVSALQETGFAVGAGLGIAVFGAVAVTGGLAAAFVAAGAITAGVAALGPYR